jgi:hypothetical protein
MLRGISMFWDSLTATGIFLSLLSATGVLYLVLRDRPRLPNGNTRS